MIRGGGVDARAFATRDVDDRLVAEMHTVEITDGRSGATVSIVHEMIVADDLHSAGLTPDARGCKP